MTIFLEIQIRSRSEVSMINCPRQGNECENEKEKIHFVERFVEYLKNARDFTKGLRGAYDSIYAQAAMLEGWVK